MFNQTVDDMKQRTGEENAILAPMGMSGANEQPGVIYPSNQGILNQGGILNTGPIMTDKDLRRDNHHHIFHRHSGNYRVAQIPPYQTSVNDQIFQENLPQQQYVENIQYVPLQQQIILQQPSTIVQQAPQAQKINHRDIREAELYQESVEGSRVQANTLAGMPLTQGNAPIQDLGAPFGFIRPYHEHYTQHAHMGQMQGTTHAHVLEQTDQMVGRAGDQMGVLNGQNENLIHADPTFQAQANMPSQTYQQTILTEQQPIIQQVFQEQQQFPQQTFTTIQQQPENYVNQEIFVQQQHQQPTQIYQEQYGLQKTQEFQVNQSQQFQVQNPEVLMSGGGGQIYMKQQDRLPNECLYCRNEDDLLPHSEHISRGMYRQEDYSNLGTRSYIVEQPVTQVYETIVQEEEVPQQEPLTDSKLPFGGTKPGQYMAQEVPLLYGWGAAPSQRLYKSNEVVGVNYSGATIATNQKLSRQEKKNLRKNHNAAVKEVNHQKLEQQYQGNVNERTGFTQNKVFQNVHEPIDSTIVENKTH